jgi:hypothetical protein
MHSCDLNSLTTSVVDELKRAQGQRLKESVRDSISVRVSELRITLPRANRGPRQALSAAGGPDSHVVHRARGVFLIERAAEDIVDLFAWCELGEIPDRAALDAAIADLESGATLAES